MGWKEWGLFAGVLVIWVVLVRWVLPWCGVSTCCCSAKQCRTAKEPPAVLPDDAGAEKLGEEPPDDGP